MIYSRAMLYHEEDDRFLPLWYHPVVITVACVILFTSVRLIFGGANYLASKAWFALCVLLPIFVLISTGLGVSCAHVRGDPATLFHVIFTLVFVQLDVVLARWWVTSCGFNPWCNEDNYGKFGSVSLFSLVLPKFGCRARVGSGGQPALVQTLVEIVGASLHEVFWNVLICQNLIDRGTPPYLAIGAVPLVSCLIHGITSNWRQGVRCAPQFLWVALAYHASGSVIPPAMIHTLWYMTDAKLLVTMNTFKRDWDIDIRNANGETDTPPFDRAWLFGLILIIALYTPLQYLSEYIPWLKSESCKPVGTYGIFTDPYGMSVSEWILIGMVVGHVIGGIVVWKPVTAGLQIIGESGDLSSKGLQKMDITMREEFARTCPCLSIYVPEAEPLTSPRRAGP